MSFRPVIPGTVTGPTPVAQAPAGQPETTVVQAPNVDLKKVYIDNPEELYFSGLIMGRWGTGKTELLTTLPQPLLIDMFDPKGEIVLKVKFRELLASGMVQYRKWENNLTGYVAWEQQIKADIRSGYLAQFASYSWDTLTSWMQMAGGYWLHLKNEERRAKGNAPLDHFAQNDYTGLYNLLELMISRISAQPLNFVVNAHLQGEKDEVTGGAMKYELAVYKKLRSIVPRLFSERLVTIKTPGFNNGPPTFQLLTNDWGLYSAATQLGTGTWDLLEVPDFKQLFAKANVPYNNKPKFWEES